MGLVRLARSLPSEMLREVLSLLKGKYLGNRNRAVPSE